MDMAGNDLMQQCIGQAQISRSPAPCEADGSTDQVGWRERRGGAVLFEDDGWGEVTRQQDRRLLTSQDRRHRPRPPAREHTPVLLSEMLAALDVRPGGAYLDATFGAGGYARAILQAGAGRVFALDRDPAAVARGRELSAESPRFIMLEGRFGQMAELLARHGVTQLDGIVLDLGVSSTQLDDPERGFSFAVDGPRGQRK